MDKGGGLSKDRAHCSSTSDTAVLVQSEPGAQHNQACEQISLDLNGSTLALHGLRFGHGIAHTLDSPSDCTTLSTVSTATASPLDHKHRYHLFFAHHVRDQPWVEHVVRQLEGEPYNYKCCYTGRDFDTSTGVMAFQSILCSIMLSQRIVIVLTPCFLEDEWSSYEESISHLTSLSQRRQRVIPVVLEECSIPETLKLTQPVDVSRDAFWDGLFQSLQMDGFPYSESLYTIRSMSSQSSGFNNGQLLVTLTATIHGFCSSKLVFDYDEVPDPLNSYDVSLSRQEYANIVKAVGREETGKKLSWLYSALPTIILGVVFVLWCVAFILVILLFPDNQTSTLPVRLCVFSLPAVFIVLSCVLRWKKLKIHKDRYSMCMFSRSVHVNRQLYDKSQPVIVTTARTRDDTFHIYFMYFNRSDCIERIKLNLTHCSDDDIEKLSKLVEVYSLNTGYMEGRPLAVRLAVMVSSAYSVNFIFKRIPHSLEQRHTRRRQCLCQFIEEFLAAYLPCIRQETDIHNLKHVFFRYLNCQLKPDPIILHTLGVSLTEAT